MSGEPRPFTLRALLIAVACFALATFLFTLDVRFLKIVEQAATSDYIKLLVLASGPVIGGLAGLGLGLLTGEVRGTAIDGAMTGFLFATIFLISWAFPGAAP